MKVDGAIQNWSMLRNGTKHLKSWYSCCNWVKCMSVKSQYKRTFTYECSFVTSHVHCTRKCDREIEPLYSLPSYAYMGRKIYILCFQYIDMIEWPRWISFCRVLTCTLLLDRHCSPYTTCAIELSGTHFLYIIYLCFGCILQLSPHSPNLYIYMYIYIYIYQFHV